MDTLSLYNHGYLVRLARRIPLLADLLHVRYERRFARATQANLFRGVYTTVAEAEASAPQSRPRGYDNPACAELYRERLERIYPTDYPVLFWLKDLLEDCRTVFDLGGHVGIAYHAYGRYLTFPTDIRWTVCDVPAVVEAGRSLAHEHGMNNLRFTTEDTEASGVDIFFASGVLQYIAEPLPEILARLAVPPRHILTNLCAFSEHGSYVTLQNIGTSFCPYIVHRRREVMDGLAALGYRLVDEWRNPEKNCLIPLYPEHSLSHYSGAYHVMEF